MVCVCVCVATVVWKMLFASLFASVLCSFAGESHSFLPLCWAGQIKVTVRGELCQALCPAAAGSGSTMGAERPVRRPSCLAGAARPTTALCQLGVAHPEEPAPKVTTQTA